ncbi:hypothetical protein ABFX02_06G080600 [Erythranthe guttata]
MGCSSYKSSILIFACLIIFESNFREARAIRPILMTEGYILVIQSLPRGAVPKSGSSPCTYIPGGKSRGRCALAVAAGEGFSGHPASAPAPAAFPPVVVRFAAATDHNI